MYAKTVNYGNTIENTHGKAVGAIKVEILPQGTFLNHVQITIEEAHPMGKHPEPMLRVSVNNQKDVVITLQTALKALGFFDGPNLGNIAIGQNLHGEKEEDNWVVSISSGFAGYRCTKCHTWVYNSEPRKCNCNK